MVGKDFLTMSYCLSLKSCFIKFQSACKCTLGLNIIFKILPDIKKFMTAIPLSIVACAEMAAPKPHTDNQLQLMLNFFHRASIEALDPVLRSFDRIDDGTSVNDVCSWKGILCANSRMITLNWQNIFKIDAFERQWSVNPYWLPPTLQEILVESFLIRNVWETRSWPRALRLLNADSCDIYGSLDTLHFPRRMEILSMCGNYLSGTVWIGKLPRTLQRINIQNDLLDAIIVIVPDIPDGFEEVVVDKTYFTDDIVHFLGAENDKRITQIS